MKTPLNENEQKKPKKNNTIHYILFLIVNIALPILLYYYILILSQKLEFKFSYKYIKIGKKKIDNNIEKNKGIVKLIFEDEKKNKISIKKELLKSINYFIACLGKPGTGKSAFGSYYYKQLYNVKNDYFEISDALESFTRGIWMISDKERRKIPDYIYKDILDVEGFQVDDAKSWKYVMVIAFLSTELIIFNDNQRYDDVKKMIKIIENSLKRMEKMNIPRILKIIYIQTILSPQKQKPIEELLQICNYDKKIFQMIEFKYIYLPKIQLKEENDLMKYPDYRINFIKILDLLNKENNFNSVASLRDYIDIFNEAINGNLLFNNQTILKDIESDFNGLYNKYENKLKNKLSLIKLKPLDNLNETFEEFINKQNNLSFEFNIKNEELTFYGGNYDCFYDELRKNKTFKIEPKDIFYDSYISERLRLQSKEKKEKEKIYYEYERIKREINNTFAQLKFYQEIEIDIDYLKLKIDTDQIEYKLEIENELSKYVNSKKKSKIKEWDDQIERAKWKAPVQAHGEMKCKNGHNLSDIVFCSQCKKELFWVDSDERYAICKGCNKVIQLSGKLKCMACGAESKSTVKWIEGYKP